MKAKFALARGGQVLLPVMEIKANGRPVASMHELAHVVQQRGCQLTLLVDDSAATGRQKTIVGGFKSLSGMDSETEVIECSAPGMGVSLGGFRASSQPSQYSPGITKYSTIKLTRA